MKQASKYIPRFSFIAKNHSKEAFLEEALYRALRTADMSLKLSITSDDTLHKAPSLSILTGSTSYIQTGLPLFQSIKGYAALGYLETSISSRLKELEAMERQAQKGDETIAEDLYILKRTFLKKHGVEKPNGLAIRVPLLDLALWEVLRECPLIFPSSGSFGYAGLQLLALLRTTERQYGPYKIVLMKEHKQERGKENGTMLDVGKVVAFLPHPSMTEVMPSAKNVIISKLGVELQCPPHYWLHNRDQTAFQHAIENNGFFCSTNPKSSEEVISLIEEIISLKGTRFLYDHRDALERMDIHLQEDKGGLCIATGPMNGSIYGLMVPKLITMEALLKEGHVIQETTFNQPSAGSTLAASGLVNTILALPHTISPQNEELLGTLFPHVHHYVTAKKKGEKVYTITSHLKGVFDTANPKLAQQLGYTGPIYQSDGNPVNGLGSFSTSDESVRCLTIASESKQPSFEMGKSMMICPHNLMQIARVVLFVEEINRIGAQARYPESAGAAGLGGWLHEAYLQNKITPRQLAYYLRSQGVTLDTFFKLVDKEYFMEVSARHGSIMKLFSDQFLEAMRPGIALEHFPERQTGLPFVCAEEALCFVNTGTNGTERFQCYAVDILEERERLKGPKKSEEVKIVKEPSYARAS